MNKRKVGRRLLVTMLVGLMTFSAAKMPVMATEGEEEHVYRAPENLVWDAERPGMGYFDITDGTRGFSVATLYKNGKRVTAYWAPSEGVRTVNYDFYTNITESGTYTFKVKLSANDGPGADDMTTGAVSVESAPFEYVRPSETIATPGNLRWSSDQQNVALWDPVENASSYHVTLYANGRFVRGITLYSGTSWDFSDNMTDADNNQYTFKVSAHSSNINVWANSYTSAPSEVYNGTSSAQTIQDNIANAANADESTVNDAVAQLKAENDPTEMGKAIQDSAAAQADLNRLENTYNQKNGITVNTNSEVGDIPTSGMSVIGAGLNATAGSTVTLNVSETPISPEYDTDIYTNVVTFDMKLVNENGETSTEITNLEIPAVITLPIPAGMDTSRLFILHFLSDGTHEKITPAIIDNGTKAKFTITHFSTFAFANENTSDLVVDFVSRMYTVALGREAEEAGLNDWVGQLRNGTNDGAGLAHGFIESQEFIGKNHSNEEYLNILYHTFFDRDPDEGGYNSWLSQLNSGASRRHVLAGFVNSQEFTNLCGRFNINRGTLPDDENTNAQVRAFVERMYVKALGRSGEEDGINSWTQRIVSGEWAAADVAKAGFFNSPEYAAKNRSNEDFVEDLYQALFDRASDEAGKADWLSRLAGGASREEIMNGFGGSQEFANMLAGFGL